MLRSFSFVLFRSPLQRFENAYSFFEESSPLFNEGIFLSSFELWNEWQKLETVSPKEKNKLLISLEKYWLRSCTRCTPFATFAGCFMAGINKQQTSLVLAAAHEHKHVSRLDMNFLTTFCNALSQIPFIKDQLDFTLNNSLYELPGSYRYAEYSIENNTRKYVLTEIEKTAYLKNVIEAVKDGCKLSELKNILLKDNDVDEPEAEAFINELCASQILISALEPAITGIDLLKDLIEQLSALKETETIVASLKSIHAILRLPAKNLQQYQLIQQQLKALPVEINTSKNAVQTDLFLSTKENITNEELIETLVQQASDLMLLARPNTNQHLEDFKQRFLKKYEDEEVPLAEVLDADFGIGYANVSEELTGETTLIKDLFINNNPNTITFKSDYISKYVLKKYAEYAEGKSSSIIIQQEELRSFQQEIKSFEVASSLYLIGSFLKQEQLLDKDHFLFDLSGFGGPSAANLLARFAHGDEQLNSFIQDILKEEESEFENVLYTEIVHLPEAKIGNILQRPVLRKHEISYTGKSGALKEDQIFINDILASIRNNKIVLRSKRLNRQIIPRLSSAHNYAYKSLPVYKFLCDLQTQNIAQPGIWDWGELNVLKFLPRVSYKNIILKKARWKIEEDDFKFLPNEFDKQKIFCSSLQQKLKLPNCFVIAEGDNELMIDLTKEKGIELFMNFAKKLKNFTVEEYLFTKENCIIKDVENAVYTNEIIIPLKNIKEKKTELRLAEPSVISIQRKFNPFREWQYYKLYCGPKAAEKILVNEVYDFINDGTASKLFEKFFFVRFKDDFSHLRLRFYNADADKQIELHKKFMVAFQPLIDENIIHNIAVDTYSRELERYRPQLIEHAETIFYFDSLAVLQLLQLIEDAANDDRLYVALKGIDILLNDFGFDMNTKHSILKKVQQSFFKEFGEENILQKQLNEKYRRHQQNIFKYLSGKDFENEIINEVDKLLSERSANNIREIKAMKTKLAANNHAALLQHLSKHFIHLFVNRLFISSQRKYELLLYHFLEKYYASQIAIQNLK